MSKVLIFFTNAGFSVVSIWICFSILFSYYLKNHEKKIESDNRNFIYYLCSIIIMSIVEVIYVLYFLKNGFDTKLAKPFYFIYSVAILMSTFSAWRYVISYSYKLKNRSEKSKKIAYSIIIILEIIIGVLIGVMPVKIFANYGIYTFESIPITITLAYTMVSTAIFIFLLYYKNNTITRKDLFPTIASCLLIIALLIFRLIAKIDINVETFQLALFALGIFFTLENQDYKLISVAKQKQDEVMEATKSQREFISNLSHEIRSPMNTILGYSQLLLQDPNLTKEGSNNEIISIHDASVSLLSLISNITDFSDSISEKEEVVESEYTIQELLIEINNRIHSRISNNKVVFDYNVSEIVPKELNGDYEKISKILFNVLSNSISYSITGHIALEIRGNIKENNIFEFEFLVKTDGNNMEWKSFDVESSEFMSLGYGGAINSNTLGLLVAKSLSELMNGKLEFVNEQGNGSKYYKLTLVQKIVDPTPVGNSLNSKENSLNADLDLTGRRILIVENNENNIMLIKRLLDKYKPNIDIFTSGKDVVEKVNVGAYDAIFMDYIMPTMDGTQTLSKLKDLYSFVPPTIALIDSFEGNIRDKYSDAGFDDFLQKPINYSELNRVLLKIFSKKQERVIQTVSPQIEGGEAHV